MKKLVGICVALVLLSVGCPEIGREAYAQSAEEKAEEEAAEEAEEQAEDAAEDRAEEEAEEQAEDAAEARAEEEAEEQAEDAAEARAEEEAEEQAEDAAEDRAEEEAEEQAEDAAEDRAEEEAEEQAEDAAEDRAEEEAEEQAEDAAEDRAEEEAEEQAEDIADDIADAEDERLDDLEDLADDLADEAEDRADDAADEAEHRADEAADLLEDLRDTRQDERSDARDRDDGARVERAEAALGTFLDPSGELAIESEIVALVSPDRIEDIRSANYDLAEETALEAVDLVAVRIRLPETVDTVQAVRDFSDRFNPDAVDFNHVYSLNAGQTDGSATPAAPDIPVTLPDAARIGLMETRVDAAHPCFSDISLQQETFHDGVASGDAGHALAVMSLLVGCHDGRTSDRPALFNADVFSRPGAGQSMATAVSLVRGLDWLVTHRVDAINMSLSGPANRLLHRAVRLAFDAGIPVVAAVGNDGPAAPPRYPAAYDEAIGITAVDSGRRVYRRAGRGQHVAFAAHGVDVVVAAQDGGVRRASGTSMATPQATRIVIQARAERPGMSSTDLVGLLSRQAADLGPAGVDPIYGHGLIRLPGK